MQGNRMNDQGRNGAPNQRSRNLSFNNFNDQHDHVERPLSQSQGSNFWTDNQSRYADPPYPNDFRQNHQFNNAQFHPYNASEGYRLPPSNSGYRGVHFDPHHKHKKGNKTGTRTTTHQTSSKKVAETVDYKLRLDHAKTWAKYDSSDFSKQATIPATDPDWKQFLEPFQVLIAQNMLVLAGDALKIDQKAAKSKGSETVLSDSEFRAKLETVTSYLKIAKPSVDPAASTLQSTAEQPE